MFGIFSLNNYKSIVEQLFSLMLEKMPGEYIHYFRQVQEGVIRRILTGPGETPNYITIIYNTKFSSAYERKNETGFSIYGVTVFDKKSGKDVSLVFYFHSGLVAGINADLNIKKCSFDINTLKIDFCKIKNDLSSEKIEKYLAELGILTFNASEVHEILVGEELMIYLRDLEDGDFLAVNSHGFYIVSMGFRQAFKVPSAYSDEVGREYLSLSSERIYSYLPD
ncbi:hypothetical protein JHU04_003084 [Brenneria sp. 4F2]|nr:hypothetical protein [Brenneria bubanii]